MEVSTTLQLYSSRAQGWFFIILGSTFLLGFLCAAAVPIFFPVSESHVATGVKIDRYYCLLVPLTLPILLVAVYFHWLSMKFFKHA